MAVAHMHHTNTNTYLHGILKMWPLRSWNYDTNWTLAHVPNTYIHVSIKMVLQNYRRRAKQSFIICYLFPFDIFFLCVACSVVKIDFLFVIKFLSEYEMAEHKNEVELSDVRKFVSFSICEHILLHIDETKCRKYITIIARTYTRHGM